MAISNYKVKHVSREDCAEYILKIHYAKRWPSVTWAFGLFFKNENFGDDNFKNKSGEYELCGVITYGTPPSSTLRKGLAGEELEINILELNRLCLKFNRRNEASILISRSIKLLPRNTIIVSYADTGQNHAGCVYQATNFLYTGMSVAASILKVKGQEHLHNITLIDQSRGQPDRIAFLRQKYGDDLYKEPNSRKHRYVYIRGNNKFKKKALAALNYKVRPYPKLSENIKDIEDGFKMADNIDNFERSEKLSSEDFKDFLI